LGLGMLLVVFDESRIHTRRLATLNALTTSIARAGEQGPMTATALQKLKDLMDADAAWFRLGDGRRLTIFQHVGLSPEFLRNRTSIPLGDPLEPIPDEHHPVVLTPQKLDAPSGAVLKHERLKQVVITAVPGKKAIAGNLILASRKSRSYAPDEFDFLETCGQQLGLALENLHLVEEILRSHRQWSNTFESMQDLILLHGADCHIHRCDPGRREKL